MFRQYHFDWVQLNGFNPAYTAFQQIGRIDLDTLINYLFELESVALGTGRKESNPNNHCQSTFLFFEMIVFAYFFFCIETVRDSDWYLICHSR